MAGGRTEKPMSSTGYTSQVLISRVSIWASLANGRNESRKQRIDTLLFSVLDGISTVPRLNPFCGFSSIGQANQSKAPNSVGDAWPKVQCPSPLWTFILGVVVASSCHYLWDRLPISMGFSFPPPLI